MWLPLSNQTIYVVAYITSLRTGQLRRVVRSAPLVSLAKTFSMLKHSNGTTGRFPTRRIHFSRAEAHLALAMLEVVALGDML